jgi:hypothetical protein
VSLSDFLGTETEHNQALKMVEAGEIKQKLKYLDIQALFSDLSASYPQKHPHSEGSASAGERESIEGSFPEIRALPAHRQWRGRH